MLQKHDLINNKHIPDLYKYNDRDTRLKVLAGLLDTDGSFSTETNSFEITKKSDVIAEDILYIARSLGLAAYSHKVEKQTGLYNIILISGNGLENIPTLLHGKQELETLQKEDALVTGISVKSVGNGDYYGFTIDENNRYLLGDFTVTHNTCTAIATATSTFEKEGYTVLWVTRTTLKNDIFKNMFDQVCHVGIQDRIRSGKNIPTDMSARMNLLSKSWRIQPMSYKQFSNLVGGKNALYEKLVSINGKEDPLRKTLLIIDEAHKLYGGEDLSSIERPDMKKLHKSIMHSYSKSGKDSVRLLMMTATPITNDPMELIKIVNLCREDKDQLPVEYTDFSKEFMVDAFGKFGKNGSRKFLDTIAGHISYLSREKDARQFSQPIITQVNVPLSRRAFNFAEEKEQLEKEIENKKKNVEAAKNEYDMVKQEIANRKKLTNEECRGLRGNALKECVKRTESIISNLIEELRLKKQRYEQVKVEVANQVQQTKKEITLAKKKAQFDSSQQSAILSKCIQKTKVNRKKRDR